MLGSVGEVLSPSNADNDLHRKLRVYHRHRVGHYWIADPESRTQIETLEQNVRDNVVARNRLVHDSTMDWKPVYDELLRQAERLVPRVRDVSLLLHEAMRAGRSILFEGAQGTLLDIDHGTYPYVTSSNTVAAQVFREGAPRIFDAGAPPPYEVPVRRGPTLAVPITWATPRGTSGLGVVTLSAPRSEPGFTAGDLKLVAAIASQIGTAIQGGFQAITSAISMITGAISAVTGIISAVEQAHTNTLLSRIERRLGA